MATLSVDTDAWALYLEIKPGKVHRTVEAGVLNIDLDRNGDVIGIECLDLNSEVSRWIRKADFE